MKLYITNYDYEKIKQSFLNLRLYYFIDIKEIIKSLGYDKKDLNEYNEFIISQTIENKIITAIESKRFKSIVYINEDLSDDIILGLTLLIKELPKIENLVLLDDDRDKKNENFYKFFKELLYFPTNKKVRIMECKPIKSKMFYWTNNLPIPNELLNDKILNNINN